MQRSEDKEGRFSDSEARAATVVRAHSVNPFSRRFFRRRRSRSTPPRPNKSEDPEKAAAANTTPPMSRAHGGILAALLALYDHRDDSDSASTTSTLRTRSGHATPERHSPTHSFMDLASVQGRRLADMSKALHLPETRPSRERNAAGVFGSLIASTTGTLVGATAPTHSSIAPDIKRPGYHLSRCVHRPSICRLFPR